MAMFNFLNFIKDKDKHQKKKCAAKKKVVKKKKISKEVSRKKKGGLQKTKRLNKILSQPKASKIKTKIIGNITHRFSKINVAVVKLRMPVKKGDKVLIKGKTTNFSQTIKSMQINHKSIIKASKNQEIGLLVKKRVRVNDKVFKI